MYNYERFGNAKDAQNAYEREKKDNEDLKDISIVEWLYSQKERYFIKICKKCGKKPVLESISGNTYFVCRCGNCGSVAPSALNEEKAVRNWNNEN